MKTFCRLLEQKPVKWLLTRRAVCLHGHLSRILLHFRTFVRSERPERTSLAIEGINREIGLIIVWIAQPCAFCRAICG